MNIAEVINTAKHARAELEALRVEIGLDKPRRSLLAHTVAAQNRVDELLHELDGKRSLSN